MKKIKILIAVLAFAAMTTLVVNAEATSIDQTVSVAASGSVSGSATLSIASGSPMAYGAGSADRFPTTPAVKINYSSNYNPWKISIYTNNTTVPSYSTDPKVGGKYAKGGLITAKTVTSDGYTIVNLAPAKWIAKIGTNTVIPAVPAAALNYNFVKDLRDEDDPATTVNPDGTPAYEDYARSFTNGYANIAYGDGSGAGVCVDPTIFFAANDPRNYRGDAIPSATRSVAIYIAGLFGSSGGITGSTTNPSVPAPYGSYSTTFYIQIYHE